MKIWTPASVYFMSRAWEEFKPALSEEKYARYKDLTEFIVLFL